MKVRFLNLSVKQKERSEILSAIDKVLQHGILINGPEVLEFEGNVKNFIGTKHCVGVNSGTDALFLALKALGIKSGDEVITTSMSWIATANAIRLVGATPVFADIDDDLNISLESIKRLITNKTKAIVPVHYTGKACKISEIVELAKSASIAVIEDSAQAFGATYNGKMVGNFGDIGTFSMNSMKVYASIGEAGAIVFDEAGLYDRLMALRHNGTVNRETCIEPSLNGRLDTVQAAALNVRFSYFDDVVKKRNKIASLYNETISRYVGTPIIPVADRHVFYTYTIVTEKRDELKRFLEANGIETKIHHPILMPQQPPYMDFTADTKNASILVRRILSLPASENLELDEQEYVISKIKEFFCGK